MLEASRNNNVSLNSEKLQFKQPKIGFYGQAITDKGIAPAAEKLEAIRNIKTPTNSKELLSILGIVSSLNRFSVKLAELTAPLRQLTKKHVHFRWEPHHQTALDKIKEEICSARVISYYDPDPATTTILQCDASEKGLGAWIRQIDSQGSEKIVAMASRSLTDTETRYSNSERECLGVMYGLEKFEYYLLGRHIVVETDHSPLEQIFNKHIADAPSRLQRILLRYVLGLTWKSSTGQGSLSRLQTLCREFVSGITYIQSGDPNTMSTSLLMCHVQSIYGPCEVCNDSRRDPEHVKRHDLPGMA